VSEYNKQAEKKDASLMYICVGTDREGEIGRLFAFIFYLPPRLWLFSIKSWEQGRKK